MVEWIAVRGWEVRIELKPTDSNQWDWSFRAVDGPQGRNTDGLAPTAAAAFQQAKAAALQATSERDGPDSEYTEFDNSL